MSLKDYMISSVALSSFAKWSVSSNDSLLKPVSNFFSKIQNLLLGRYKTPKSGVVSSVLAVTKHELGGRTAQGKFCWLCLLTLSLNEHSLPCFDLTSSEKSRTVEFSVMARSAARTHCLPNLF